MCKGSNTTTSSSMPNAQAYGLYSDLLQRAQGVANTPYQAYGGELVSPVNQQQQLGISNINAAQGAFPGAVDMARQAGQPLTQARRNGALRPANRTDPAHEPLGEHSFERRRNQERH